MDDTDIKIGGNIKGKYWVDEQKAKNEKDRIKAEIKRENKKKDKNRHEKHTLSPMS